MKRRLFRPRTGLLFIPAVLLVGWALYPPEYAVMATHSSVTHDPPPIELFPWFIHGNDDLSTDSFLGSIAGENDFVAIRTDGVERMRIYESDSMEADSLFDGLVEIQTNLKLTPEGGFDGDIVTHLGIWHGKNFEDGGLENRGTLRLFEGDVSLTEGNINTAYGQWKGETGVFDRGDLLMEKGNLEIGPYPMGFRPALTGNLLVAKGQYLHGTDFAPAEPPHGEAVIRVDAYGHFPKNGAAANHIVFIKSHDDPDNFTDTPDGLAIQLKRDTSTADAPLGETIETNSFITFINGNDVPVGRIFGFFDPEDPSGPRGVTLASGGGDFAECLKKIDPAANFEPGEIVGVYGGRISKQTEGADHVMVITGRPVVVGNAPPAAQAHLFEDVAFIGQVPVLVRGAVAAGDYIVPSGFGDGIGVAIAPEDLTVANLSQIVGKAWTGFQPAQNRRGGVNNRALGTVNVAIGVGSTDQQAIVDAFNRQLAGTLRRVNALARRVADLEGGN